jgi:hypothetical protein
MQRVPEVLQIIHVEIISPVVEVYIRLEIIVLSPPYNVRFGINANVH